MSTGDTQVVANWMDACRKGDDPVSVLTDVQRSEFVKGWREYVDNLCGQVERTR